MDLHNAAFRLGLHCLANYPFKGFQSTKGHGKMMILYLKN